MNGALALTSRRLLVPLLTTTVAFVGLTGSAGSARAGTFPGPNGRIAFTSDRAADGAAFQVFTARPDGSDLRQITHVKQGFGAEEPGWSADGRWVVLDIDNGQSQKLLITSADGTRRRQVGKGLPGCPGQASFSPSGRQITFVLWPGSYPDCFVNNPDLYIIRTDGTHLQQLTDTPTLRELVPEWSPEGHWIAYDAHTDGNFDHGIYVIKRDGTGARRITPGSLPSVYPKWSPDGGWITFAGYDNHFRIYVVHPDGTARKALTNAPALLDDFDPAFSPNGNQIAFLSDRLRDDDADLFVMNVDGSHIRRVLAAPGRQITFGTDWGTNQNTAGTPVNVSGSTSVASRPVEVDTRSLPERLTSILRHS